MKKLFIFFSLLSCAALISCSSANKTQDYVAVTKDASGVVTNVQYAGQCAMAVSQGNFKVGGDKSHKYTDANTGKIYYFASADAKSLFIANKADYTKLADQKWKNYISGRVER